jgi:hypothetical protein
MGLGDPEVERVRAFTPVFERAKKWSVGWVERGETHQPRHVWHGSRWVSQEAQPILQAIADFFTRSLAGYCEPIAMGFAATSDKGPMSPLYPSYNHMRLRGALACRKRRGESFKQRAVHRVALQIVRSTDIESAKLLVAFGGFRDSRDRRDSIRTS